MKIAFYAGRGSWITSVLFGRPAGRPGLEEILLAHPASGCQQQLPVQHCNGISVGDGDPGITAAPFPSAGADWPANAARTILEQKLCPGRGDRLTKGLI